MAVDPEHPNRAAAGSQRQEQPFAAGQCIGTAPGGMAVLPTPASRRHIGIVQAVFWRVGASEIEHFDSSSGSSRTVFSLSIDETWNTVAHSRSSSVPIAGDLAAERVELGGRFGAGARRHDLRAGRGGQVADDDRHQREEEQSDDVFGIGNREGVERRDEEEIEGQHAQASTQTATAIGPRRSQQTMTAVRNTSETL